jgi:hypothetical protein
MRLTSAGPTAATNRVVTSALRDSSPRPECGAPHPVNCVNSDSAKKRILRRRVYIGHGVDCRPSVNDPETTVMLTGARPSVPICA